MDDDSKCRKNILCDFTTSRDLPDAVIRVCVQCGKRVVYSKDKNGRIDNRKFLRDNIRETVQPLGKNHKLFLEIYGEKILKDFEKSIEGRKTKKEIAQEWEDMRRDIRREFEKNTLYT